jgi:hypothetical protein
MLDYNKPSDWFNKIRPDTIIITDYEISDAYRLKDNNSISPEDSTQVNKILANMDYVKKNYSLYDVYSDIYDYPSSFSNKRMISSSRLNTYSKYLFGSPAKDLPHDMKYTLPTIYIYKLKK